MARKSIVRGNPFTVLLLYLGEELKFSHGTSSSWRCEILCSRCLGPKIGTRERSEPVSRRPCSLDVRWWPLGPCLPGWGGRNCLRVASDLSYLFHLSKDIQWWSRPSAVNSCDFLFHGAGSDCFRALDTALMNAIAWIPWALCVELSVRTGRTQEWDLVVALKEKLVSLSDQVWWMLQFKRTLPYIESTQLWAIVAPMLFPKFSLAERNNISHENCFSWESQPRFVPKGGSDVIAPSYAGPVFGCAVDFKMGEGFRGWSCGAHPAATATGNICKIRVSGFGHFGYSWHFFMWVLVMFLLQGADWCTGYFQSEVISWAICGAADSVSILSRCVRANMKNVKDAKNIPPKEASKGQKSSLGWLTWHSSRAFPLSISDMSSGGCRKVFSPQKSEFYQSNMSACIQQWAFRRRKCFAPAAVCPMLAYRFI